MKGNVQITFAMNQSKADKKKIAELAVIVERLGISYIYHAQT